MKCLKYESRWCCYWVEGKCVYDFSEVNDCLSPQLAPIGNDWEWLWEKMSDRELMEHISVMRMVVNEAKPNDPHNPIDKAECGNAKYLCEMSLAYAILVYEMKIGIREEGPTIKPLSVPEGRYVDETTAAPPSASPVDWGEPVVKKEEEGEWV